MDLAWLSRVDYHHNRCVSQKYCASWRILLRALHDSRGGYRVRSDREMLSKLKSSSFRAPLVSVAALHFSLRGAERARPRYFPFLARPLLHCVRSCADGRESLGVARAICLARAQRLYAVFLHDLFSLPGDSARAALRGERTPSFLGSDGLDCHCALHRVLHFCSDAGGEPAFFARVD